MDDNGSLVGIIIFAGIAVFLVIRLRAVLGRRTGEERERQKLSKYAMAERSGLSEQMIGYVERGMRNPSLETVLRMTAALEVDLGEVVRRAYKAAAKAR